MSDGLHVGPAVEQPRLESDDDFNQFLFANNEVYWNCPNSFEAKSRRYQTSKHNPEQTLLATALVLLVNSIRVRCVGRRCSGSFPCFPVSAVWKKESAVDLGLWLTLMEKVNPQKLVRRDEPKKEFEVNHRVSDWEINHQKSMYPLFSVPCLCLAHVRGLSRQKRSTGDLIE